MQWQKNFNCLKFNNYYKRDKRNFDVEVFFSDLIKLTSMYENVNNRTPIDISFEQFISHFEGIINKHASLRLLTCKGKQLKCKPWITKAILILCKHKIKNKSHSGTCTKDYKQYKNELTHIKEQAKRMYYENLICRTIHNCNLMLKSIKDIFRYNRKTP